MDFQCLKFDPMGPLLGSEDRAIHYFARRDLLGDDVGPVTRVWELAEVSGLIRKQGPEGSFGRIEKRDEESRRKALIETWRLYRVLVQKYRMDRAHPAVEKATEFLLSCQSEEGDIRGFLANQYAPYYTGAILGLMIDAGYAADARIRRGLDWLVNMRQDDGGWVIGSPGLISTPSKEAMRLTADWSEPPRRDFDRSKPFSAAGTGMALRALAAHPDHKRSREALGAAERLKGKMLRRDNGSSYQHPDNWIRFQYPYWWTHLVSAMDTLSLMGIPKEDPDVQRGLVWLRENQQPSGAWRASYSSIHSTKEDAKSRSMSLWITLSICTILKRYGYSCRIPRSGA